MTPYVLVMYGFICSSYCSLDCCIYSRNYLLPRIIHSIFITVVLFNSVKCICNPSFGKLFIIIFTDTMFHTCTIQSHIISVGSHLIIPVGVKSCPSSVIHYVYSFLTLSFSGFIITSCLLPYTLWRTVAAPSWFS